MFSPDQEYLAFWLGAREIVQLNSSSLQAATGMQAPRIIFVFLQANSGILFLPERLIMCLIKNWIHACGNGKDLKSTAINSLHHEKA